VTTCPECDSALTVQDDLRLNELIECADCRCELEVLAIDPLLLAIAPEPEEDWGE
jgi:alpha-aminoadipate carrier protein LysW